MMDIERTLKAANAIFIITDTEIARDISFLLTEAVDEVKRLQSQITELQGEKERMEKLKTIFRKKKEEYRERAQLAEKANTNLQQQVARYRETMHKAADQCSAHAPSIALNILEQVLQADQEKKPIVMFRCRGCGKEVRADDVLPPDVCPCGRGYGGAESYLADQEKEKGNES